MRKLRAGFVGVLAVVAIGLLAGAVAASHLINRTYTGTISGGGTVRFDVTGTDVDNFIADRDGAGTTCTPRTLSNMTLGTVGNHNFSGTSGVTATLFSVNGRFPTAGTASGTLTISGQATGTCNTPTNTAWSATTQVAATPTPTTGVPTRSLPKSGSPAGVVALSGLSLLEAGWGLRLLSRRFDTPLHMVPAFLLRKLLRARRHGRDEVKLTDEWYLVWRKDEDR